MSLAVFLATALILGMRHALEPDHLVAVTTLVSEENRLWPAARLGLVWGLGHQLPLVVLGVPVLLLRLHLPESMEHVVDLGVGFILIALGIRVVWRLRQQQVHGHVHEHNGHSHTHFHAHEHAPHSHGHAHPAPNRDRQGWLTFCIGLVHGLGGSGAIVVLALASAPTLARGALYLFTFGTGVVVGMFALTLFLVGPAISTAARFTRAHTVVRAAAGLASVALGAFMWYQILPMLRA